MSERAARRVLYAAVVSAAIAAGCVGAVRTEGYGGGRADALAWAGGCAAVGSAAAVAACGLSVAGRVRPSPPLRTARNVAGLAAFAFFAAAGAPLAAFPHRRGALQSRLEARYAALAAAGPPFPAAVELPPGAGYRVSDDRRACEIYFPDGSDTFTLIYPVGEWEWRGYGHPRRGETGEAAPGPAGGAADES